MGTMTVVPCWLVICILILRETRAFIADGENQVHQSRHLLATINGTPATIIGILVPASNCTPRPSAKFPADFVNLEQKRDGWIAVHIFIALYGLGAIALVCQWYFVPSLEVLCQRMGVPEDVAGATFMAFGTSAPELATAIIGVFVTETNVGIDTVSGSAVFNLFFITSICCIFSTSCLTIRKWPVFRDTVAFCIAAMVLILVLIDGVITWYESLITILVYLTYICLMAFSKRLEVIFSNLLNSLRLRQTITPLPLPRGGLLSDDEDDDDDDETTPLTSSSKQCIRYNIEIDAEEAVRKYHIETGETTGSEWKTTDEESSLEAVKDNSSDSVDTRRIEEIISSRVRRYLSRSSLKFPQVDKPRHKSPIMPPRGWFGRIIWVIYLPLNIVLFLTIPDCKRPGCWSRLFPLTFITATLWIAGISYTIVWMVEIIGETFSIPEPVMGVTFLAIGTSLPDVISSLLAARLGHGDMAVSNIIGSNVFDLMCSGLPWFIRTAITKPDSVIPVATNSIFFTLISLLVTAVLTVIGFHMFKWRMSKWLGVSSAFCYAVFLTIALLYQFNYFGVVNLPLCAEG